MMKMARCSVQQFFTLLKRKFLSSAIFSGRLVFSGNEIRTFSNEMRIEAKTVSPLLDWIYSIPSLPTVPKPRPYFLEDRPI